MFVHAVVYWGCVTTEEIKIVIDLVDTGNDF